MSAAWAPPARHGTTVAIGVTSAVDGRAQRGLHTTAVREDHRHTDQQCRRTPRCALQRAAASLWPTRAVADCPFKRFSEETMRSRMTKLHIAAASIDEILKLVKARRHAHAQRRLFTLARRASTTSWHASATLWPRTQAPRRRKWRWWATTPTSTSTWCAARRPEHAAHVPARRGRLRRAFASGAPRPPRRRTEVGARQASTGLSRSSSCGRRPGVLTRQTRSRCIRVHRRASLGARS